MMGAHLTCATSGPLTNAFAEASSSKRQIPPASWLDSFSSQIFHSRPATSATAWASEASACSYSFLHALSHMLSLKLICTAVGAMRVLLSPCTTQYYIFVNELSL